MQDFEVIPVYLNGGIFWICKILPFSIFISHFFHKNVNISKSIRCVLKASPYAFIWVSALSHRCDLADLVAPRVWWRSPKPCKIWGKWGISALQKLSPIWNITPMWKSWHSNESIWTGLQHTPDAFADIRIFMEKIWEKDGKRQNLANSKNFPIQIHRENFKAQHIWSSVKFCRTPVEFLNYRQNVIT